MWIRKGERDTRRGVVSPVPTQAVSNEEFIPRPQNERQKQLESLIGEMSAANAKKLGMDRRAFMASSMGLATCWLATNKVYGAALDVAEAEAYEPAATEEKFPKSEYFIFDVQSHFTIGYALNFRSAEFVKKFMTRVWLKNVLRRFATYHFFIEVQLQDFYQRHRAKFIPIDPQQDALFKEQQQSDPNALFRDAIQGICDLARGRGVKPILLFQPVLGDLTSTNASPVLVVKRVVAERSGVPLVDLTAELQPEGKALYLDADPVHLNARGNEIISGRLFEKMKDTVKP